MPTLLYLFFQHLGNEFPFLSCDETTRKLYERTLSAVVANCIAALAVRYADIHDSTGISPQIASERYQETAQIILSTNIVPSYDTAHALFLLSSLERKNRGSNSQTYRQMGMTMIQQLNAVDGGFKQHRLRGTWTSAVPVHAIANDQ